MKKTFAILCMVMCVLALLPATGAKEPEAIATAGLSGKIMIYTSIYPDVIEELDAALAKKFPTVDVEFFYGGTGALQAKLAAEIASGKLGCDMLLVAEPSYSLELKQLGILHPFKSAAASKLEHLYDAEGYWYPVRICNMVLAYNPEKYKKADLPNSFKDFAYDARVKGAVSMGNPLTSGTTLASISALKDKYGYEYYTALGNQQVKVESGSVALTKLETGECKIIMILEESVLQKRELDGSKLEVIYPTDGTINIPSTVMSVNDKWNFNKNTKAAEAISEWLLSIEGQQNIVNGWMHSVRSDFPTAPYDARPTAEIMKNTMPVDWAGTVRDRDVMRTRFQEAVTAKK